MPIDIEGWIEVRNSETSSWQGLENISRYLIFAGTESDYLFGFTKVPSGNSIAANRGLPKDVSAEAESDLDEWRVFEHEESNFEFDELFGFSHITYREILDNNIECAVNGSKEWLRVFEKMAAIMHSGNDPKNIRVVVWAIW